MAKGKGSKITISTKRVSGVPPAGIYRCMIKDITINPEAPSGFPSINCQCVVDDPKQTDHNGKMFFSNLSLSPNARWKVDEALDALGAPEDGELDPAWLIGKRFFGLLEQGEYDGRAKIELAEWIARETVQERLAAFAEEEAEEVVTPGKKGKKKKKKGKPLPTAEEEAPLAEAEEVEEPSLDEVMDDLDDLWEDD